MMRPMTTIAKRHEIRWLVRTAEGAWHEVMNVRLALLAHFTAGDTAIVVAGKHDLP